MQENNTQSPDQRAFKDVVPLALGTLVWLATLALARFGPEFLWDFNPVASWIAVAVNLVAAVGWIVIHARYLRRVDDLQRKILLDAMAVALGVGLAGGFTLAAAESAKLLAFDVNVALVSALMGVVYAVASVVGTVRYR